MTEITFPPEHIYIFERDVIEFPARADGRTIVCRITLEEMLREFHRGSLGTLEDDFQSLRPQIEQRARKLILDKDAEDDL